MDTTEQAFSQFSGAGAITAGTGLSKTGSTLNVGDADLGVQVNANDLEIDASEIASTGLEQGASTHLLRLAAQGNGIAGGAGSTLSVQADATGGAGLARVVNVSANGVAIIVEENYIKEDGGGNLSLARLPTKDGPANGATGIVITCTLASVTGVFIAGETVTQTTSAAAGVLVGAAIVGTDLELHILTTTAGWVTTAGYNITGASGDTVVAPTNVGTDLSPTGSLTNFALSLPGSTAAKDVYLVETLQVFRNGVLQYLAGSGDGTANDDIIGGANVDYYYYHDADSGTPGEIEFQVAPAVGELIDIFYDGYQPA